jgi:hypothetical protein
MAVTGTAADVDLAEVYQDLHAHPELGFTETRTAGIAHGRDRGRPAQGAGLRDGDGGGRRGTRLAAARCEKNCDKTGRGGSR